MSKEFKESMGMMSYHIENISKSDRKSIKRKNQPTRNSRVEKYNNWNEIYWRSSMADMSRQKKESEFEDRPIEFILRGKEEKELVE